MFDFGIFRPSFRLPEVSVQHCTSFYGHDFQPLNDTSIYCPHCGAIRKVAE